MCFAKTWHRTRCSIPAKTIHWTCFSLMLANRLRRRPNIKPAQVLSLMLTGIWLLVSVCLPDMPPAVHVRCQYLHYLTLLIRHLVWLLTLVRNSRLIQTIQRIVWGSITQTDLYQVNQKYGRCQFIKPHFLNCTYFFLLLIFLYLSFHVVVPYKAG